MYEDFEEGLSFQIALRLKLKGYRVWYKRRNDSMYEFNIKLKGLKNHITTYITINQLADVWFNFEEYLYQWHNHLIERNNF